MSAEEYALSEKLVEAEAEIARLTAERDGYERRYDTAKFQAALAEARAVKAEALVEAGLGVADHYANDQRFPEDALVPVESVVTRLRAALGGAK